MKYGRHKKFPGRRRFVFHRVSFGFLKERWPMDSMRRLCIIKVSIKLSVPLYVPRLTRVTGKWKGVKAYRSRQTKHYKFEMLEETVESS